MPCRLAIHGAAGRMGRRLIAIAHEDDQFSVVAALESSGHPDAGRDAGVLAGVGEIGIPLTDHCPVTVDAVIDFSVPQAVPKILAECREHHRPLVVATTGLDAATEQSLHEAAQEIPIVFAPSMSLAVNLTMKLAAVAAEVLKRQGVRADVEIVERHHHFKEDAPSGTALKFGEIISQIMDLSKTAHGREGRPGARPADEIGYHALRAGDHPGEHTIYFGLTGESIELSVRAINRDSYAIGALTAARFVAGQSPGLYNMADVLGLEG